MFKLFSRTMLAAIVAAVASSSARADFDDQFLTPSPAVGPTTVSISSPFTSSTVIAPGLTRTVNATVTNNGLGGTSAILGDVSGTGVFSFGLGTAAKGSATINYSYATPTNLSGTGTDFILTFLSADLNVPFTVTLKDSSSATASQNSTAAVGGGTYTFSMASFGGVNLSSVSDISIAINAGAGSVTSADFALTRAEIATPPNTSVPAPAGAVLALFALPVLGLYRRRQLKNAAQA